MGSAARALAAGDCSSATCSHAVHQQSEAHYPGHVEVNQRLPQVHTNQAARQQGSQAVTAGKADKNMNTAQRVSTR